MNTPVHISRELLGQALKSNFQRTAEWLAACGKQPGDEAQLSVQIGCHLEELGEFFDTLNIESPTLGTSAAMQEVSQIVKAIGMNLKRGNALARIYDREMALDALCDAEVTGNGVAFLAGFIKPTADQRVLASNEAKLVDGKPVILEGGKIGKPEGWVAPDLSDLV